MRAFLMLYSTDFEIDNADDDEYLVIPGKSLRSEPRGFTLLCSVCWKWRLTLTGWPQSPTGQWVRHQLKKLIRRELLQFFFPVYTPAYMHYKDLYLVFVRVLQITVLFDAYARYTCNSACNLVSQVLRPHSGSSVLRLFRFCWRVSQIYTRGRCTPARPLGGNFHALKQYLDLSICV